MIHFLYTNCITKYLWLCISKLAAAEPQNNHSPLSLLADEFRLGTNLRLTLNNHQWVSLCASSVIETSLLSGYSILNQLR